MKPLLVNTKIIVPPLQPNILPRPRLLEQVETGYQAGHSLTLVAAPAGFGKTTAVCAWLAQEERKVAWVSLEEDDNEITVFWAYFFSALQKVMEGFGASALAALSGPQPRWTQTILVELINEMSANPDPVVCVLDDYHAIANPEIHASLDYLLRHQPQSFHLVLITRADPPFSLARLRGRRQLTELREADLRFSTEEIEWYLNDLMGLNLSEDDLQSLVHRTEGWIVGLTLAAQSIRASPDPDQFVRSFTGSHHFVLEYLLEEVLNHQPEEVRRFLLEVSILNRMNGSLCDAVTNRQGGDEILQQLQRESLFILPLDQDRWWFRFHHLFTDLLGNLRDKQLPPGRVRSLHRRASEWYEAAGDLEQGIRHALQGEGFEQAALLIEQAAQGLISQGRLQKLLHWIEALPEPTLLARPRLRLYQGWAQTLQGKSDQASGSLQALKTELEILPASAERRRLRGELAAVLVSIATVREDPAQVIREGREALSYLPEEDLNSRARVRNALGTAYAYHNETEEAVKNWRQARDLALRAGNYFLAAAATELLAGLLMYHQGRLREAARLLAEVIESGTTETGEPLPFTGIAHALLGEIYLEWHDLQAAEDYLTKGLALTRQGGIGYGLTHIYCAHARLHQALDDPAAAERALATAAKALGEKLFWHMIVHQLACQVRFWLWRGESEAARHWAAGDPALIKREIPDSLPVYLREVQQVAMAKSQLALGNPERALEILGALLPTVEAERRTAREIEINLYAAVGWFTQGNQARALARLEACLSLAEPEGYVQLFRETGEAGRRLLEQAARRGVNPGYIEKLLTASALPADRGVPGERIALSQAPDKEPLTKREAEVLQLIGAGYSNQEIADRLVVTLNTVKKHTSNLYGKLGVRSRAQAILEAQQRQLL